MRLHMWLSHCVFAVVISANIAVLSADDNSIAQGIISRALKDGIDLAPFNFTSPALEEIVSWYHFHKNSSNISSILLNPPNGSITVDVHAHHVPTWYQAIVPLTGQSPTPTWTLESQLIHMFNQSIRRSILSASTPSGNVFLGEQNATIALSRLMNENSAAIVRALPDRFSFMASVPLPYTQESISEATYAIETLGAAGVALMSNAEGLYLGSSRLTPFFSAMNAKKAVVFVHPTDPRLEVDGQLILANPTVYTDGRVEFYFETARIFMDLAISHTIQNFTGLNFIIPHVGGSLPSIIDRAIQYQASIGPDVPDPFLDRCWWDSAGLTYAHQLGGLLAYNISPSTLLFGTDYPYLPPPTQLAFDMIESSPFLNEREKNAMRGGNVKRLFAGKIKF